ncbi:hypothetical protein NLG97_g4226 [Lecanicillium saksenae]|uniref:Uncharacterized protein n=1 Tax=Lecanicillium saksenae TaxID=468837 RepID=A0ACC1QX34_9HYPO|nr:hypothetical protein NLG97_g4226 [Lecanicillium saksenae]
MEPSKEASGPYFKGQLLSLDIEPQGAFKTSSNILVRQAIAPWTPEIEDSYINFIRSDTAAAFFNELSMELEYGGEEDTWNAAEEEAVLSYDSRALYAAETATYDVLHAYQGKSIPQLLSKVTMPINWSDSQTPSDVLEYTITQVLGDMNILNTDVHPRNFMVVLNSKGEYQTYMIDFAQSRFRRASESNKEWGCAKWRQHDEGALASIMSARLRAVGFKYKYEHKMTSSTAATENMLSRIIVFYR